jgi:hypothetical protein
MPAAGAADFAAAAGVVNLGRDAGSVVERAEELVAEDAPEAHVAAGELEVGVADPGAADLDNDLAGAWSRFAEVASESGGGAVAKDAEHGS